MLSAFFSRSIRLIAALLSVAATAHAADVPSQFRFCSMDVSFAPYAKVDGSGHIQYLIVQAAKSLNLNFERHVAPRRRCLEEIKNGQADGMIAAYSPDRAEYGAFPMAAGEPDESKALVVVRYLLYRRGGTKVDWDGQRFVGLGDGMIGVESGFIYLTEKLKQLGIPYDEGAKSLEQNLIKLTKNRVDGVIAMDIEGNTLMTDRFAGQIERVAKPFDQTALFLMVSKPFYARNPKFMESYWQAIKAYRGTADYRQYQQRNP